MYWSYPLNLFFFLYSRSVLVCSIQSNAPNIPQLYYHAMSSSTDLVHLQDCDEFFKLLSLCHTVLPAMEDDKLIYNAQSPDEAALVKAAKNFGYVFLKRSPFSITVHKLSSGEEVNRNMLGCFVFARGLINSYFAGGV